MDCARDFKKKSSSQPDNKFPKVTQILSKKRREMFVISYGSC